jgi:hypothetical protein
MRFFITAIMSVFLSSFTAADMKKSFQAVTDLSEFSRNSKSNHIEWSNQRPEQRHALDQFYQSVNQAAATQSGNPEPSAQREIQVQQMRTMNPQQRQQMFLNYIQQNR